jgi:hypothetical protein
MLNNYRLEFCFDHNPKETKFALVKAYNEKEAENKLFAKFKDVFIISIKKQ